MLDNTFQKYSNKKLKGKSLKEMIKEIAKENQIMRD